MTGPLHIARAAWGVDIPDWIEALALECEHSSQNKVAAKLDRSGALVSQVLRNKYPGDLIGLEERFRAEFQDAGVDCPVLGQIALTACLDWRRKARNFQNTNGLRVRMFRACAACPKNRKDHRNEE